MKGTPVSATKLPEPEMHELRVQNINEGTFINAANAELREGIKQLIRHRRDTESKTGKVKLKLEIDVGWMEKTDSLIKINTKITKTLPGKSSTSFAKESPQGYAIVQPVGSNGDPDQMLFNGRGDIAGQAKDLLTESAQDD